MSQTRVADTSSWEAYTTPLSTRDDGLYHPGKYSAETTSIFKDALTNPNASTLKGAISAANAMKTSIPQYAVWHTTGVTQDKFYASNENRALTVESLESSRTALLSGTPSATISDFPITSVTPGTKSLPQAKETMSKNSHRYQLALVILLASLILLMVLSWLKRRTDQKKAILATHHQPTNPKDRFASALCQLRDAMINFAARSWEALSTISASFTSLNRHAENFPDGDTATYTTKRNLMESILEKNIQRFMDTAKSFSNARRWITDLLRRRRASRSAHAENDENIAGTSRYRQHRPRSRSIYGTEKQSYTDTNSTIASIIIPPPPAIVPSRSHLDNDCGLNGNAPEKPRLVISPDRANLEENYPASESSYATKISEDKPLQTIDECHGCGQASSVRLLRFHIHRVEMDYTARKDTQLSVKEGDEVVLTRIFDDGWVFCEVTATNEQGLVPRACLSAWPCRHKNAPASFASIQIGAPSTINYTNSRPGTPALSVSPGSPTASVFPRFYSSESSSRSVS